MTHLCAILAHNQPTFVIAHQMECSVCHSDQEIVDFKVQEQDDCEECQGSGYWWITTMGGWRVFPYWSVPLYDIDDRHELSPDSEGGLFVPCFEGIGNEWRPGTPPPHHPDSVWKDGNDAAQAMIDKEAGRPLLEKIGLIVPKEPLVRRI